ncbi:toll/interleukin-1 receptor domain-containing protein [Demequina capsici]|uniref:Toll/interleukin-1 receptor domain-containing protein n=1 Tax=Demequina capsici TaxID=3075620 RepID=A0AA96FEK0_9MICO|nr:toll/interleukin-1 receptor domain-containing protein [Demequina sp. PMTSA13]WNM28150.1 toll/interleukin-1 receptor domain-containing protein [Demequina sp. PMTSA13]
MTVAPPILDVFVVWHPDDVEGRERFTEIHEHFHSPAFSGLAGGAVEVYGRSEPWTDGSAPRPFGIEEPLCEGLPAAQFNMIVVVVDANLLRAGADPGNPWNAYLHEIVRLRKDHGVGVFPIIAEGLNWETSVVGAILGEVQSLPQAVSRDRGLLGRELAQAISQQIRGRAGLSERLTVFVSHTKHGSLAEAKDVGPAMYEHVRDFIQSSHLSAFFDAQDIQPGDAWADTLEQAAASSALLMIRTDVYAAREWTQREVCTAKRSGMPVVCMHALTAGEERGSFLMDHVPSVVSHLGDPGPGVARALNRLVDETLKYTLWRAQTSYLSDHGFDWLPAQSPEPTTLAPWLIAHQEVAPDDKHLWVIHPDPPLGEAEREVLLELCAMAGFKVDVDILTPRTFAARGGELKR